MSAHKKNTGHDATESTKTETAIPTCGIVRPIAAIDGLSESHWDEIHSILCQAIEAAGFKPNLVSNASESGIIQKRIIENLYANEIVVCDISAKNPNVMFELGMRLAFDKPTIVIKDDLTPFSFDTSPIEHLQYRRDLRYTSVNEFKEKLTKQILATYEKSKDDSNYSTFLKHFGTFTVAKIERKEVSKEDHIINTLESITKEIASLRQSTFLSAASFNSAKAHAELLENITPTAPPPPYQTTVLRMENHEKRRLEAQLFERSIHCQINYSDTESHTKIDFLFHPGVDRIHAVNAINGILNRILISRNKPS